MHIKHFPLTHTFVAHISALLKGGNPIYWFDALTSYTITAHCKCKHCYTFTLESDEDFGGFDSGDCIQFFDKTLVVMHHNKNGTLREFEIPTCDDIVPYADEYLEFFNPEFHSDITAEQADEICKTWIEAAWSGSGFEAIAL